MAKYGTFPYGSAQQYGTSSVTGLGSMRPRTTAEALMSPTVRAVALMKPATLSVPTMKPTGA